MKPFIAYNVQITGPIIEAAVARMRKAPFKAAALAEVVSQELKLEDVRRASVKRSELCLRVADRIIQHYRKAGKIASEKRIWHWID